MLPASFVMHHALEQTLKHVSINLLLQDKLIGTLRVVETRMAKYVAVSRLTPDLLDTTGEMTVYEGTGNREVR